jgi:hypothetical protein
MQQERLEIRLFRRCSCGTWKPAIGAGVADVVIVVVGVVVFVLHLLLSVTVVIV